MTTNLFTFVTPRDLILEIPQNAYNQAWGKSQVHSNPTSRYQAYLNELCLSAVLPWLQEDVAPQAKVWFNTTALPSFWELVNGTVICIDATRVILVPQESIDLGELRVPQEWVDIPSWIGDYYLGVEIEPEDGYVRVWSYCTHAQLKQQGTYDASTRTYALDASDVIDDICIFSTACQICTNEVTRSQVAALPALSATQANNLIVRLGDREMLAPRLEIPFPTWGALIEHGGWRKKLYQQRIGQPEQFSIFQWLQTSIPQAVRELGWDAINLQLGAGARSLEETAAENILSRQLTIAGQNYELRVIPQIEAEEDEESIIWRFELRNTAVGGVIPGGFKLRLLTEDLQTFPDNEITANTATEVLAIEVALEAGEGIVWEIEPLPENCDREILRF
ncbi:DUF1822 family protein [Calothrix sp. UHCC 0171]|uniref:DUF1822 family protein n=1 Tax=Calothrix sp. UHCC 0171 TaxID=3110245 RepID=UPI002B22038B|nr:DUF1822 family protein [Calothrix sp. UHCC 0171]MEA5574154.1 DUF1822 family protein [Calothrix sp. UHCC 0171]